MKNFSVNIEGKEYWISRSTCVVNFVYRKDGQGNWNILITKRGKGCPNNVGKWCCPCGYIDYDETIKGAAMRELFEETGIALDQFYFNIVGIQDKPIGNQNITFRFQVDASFVNPNSLKTTNAFSEPNEIDEIMWIPIAKIDEFDFAFEHRELILKYIPEDENV